MSEKDLIDPVEARLNSHEAICAVRYDGIYARLKRMEQVFIVAAGFIIATLLSIVAKL